MIFANYKPQSYTKMLETFLSSQETFFCRNFKNYSMSFLGWCNVETTSHPGIKGLSCSKVARFEGGFIQKTFPGQHYLFSWGLIWSMYFLTICPWNKFEEKAQCEAVWHLIFNCLLNEEPPYCDNNVNLTIRRQLAWKECCIEIEMLLRK